MTNASTADESGVDELLRGEFGFTWGETDGTTWLRNDDGDYKRLDPSFFDRLRELAHSECEPASVDPRVRQTIALLADEGYLRRGGEITHHETPSDIRLWPRVGAFAAMVALWLACLAIRRAELRRLPSELPFGLEFAVLVLPILLASTAIHELGHYTASRRYFTPTIRFGWLNKIIPAVITRTTDAWACPRNARIWISLAGPFVDALVAATFAAAFVAAPDRHVLGFLALLIGARMLFVLNPLIEGDGYWVVVDAFGLHNLRSRGFRDLKRATPSGPAAYALAVVVFTTGFAALNLYVITSAVGII
ncbi:hypothetical protein [Halopiger djelfimassiliensis]|uniref:hypothetical protein n=1 Tax=Halopiger djelfimassiliensis TaxID=1293047 RepID=UPI0006776056|nr:hypothetical protein [Halopiger djelfimassiliensis]